MNSLNILVENLSILSSTFLPIRCVENVHFPVQPAHLMRFCMDCQPDMKRRVSKSTAACPHSVYLLCMVACQCRRHDPELITSRDDRCNSITSECYLPAALRCPQSARACPEFSCGEMTPSTGASTIRTRVHRLHNAIFDTARIIGLRGAGSVKLSSVRLSACLSVRPSICPIIRPPLASATSLLWRPGDVDRLQHGRRSAANASSVTLSADVGSLRQHWLHGLLLSPFLPTMGVSVCTFLHHLFCFFLFCSLH